jgi:HTH-type transcriptional regulator/antitoxin HigA
MPLKFKTMEIKVIKTEEQYEAALNRVEEIFDSTKTSETADELELLTVLVEKYENEYHPISLPDPIEAIKFRMEQMGYQQKDLAKVIGLKSRTSEILNRKRKLTIDVIRKLHNRLGIPTDVLIKEY